MTLADYLRILDLPDNASLDEIKKAYRKKARTYHPDINTSPEAKDKFIEITEAYDFLIANYDRITDNEKEYQEVMEQWRKYRQKRSQQKARTYAQASYIKFKKSELYRTTRIFDGTTVIFSLIISIMVIAYSLFGYFYRLKHPLPQFGKPSVFSFIMVLLMGIIFFIVSIIYLKAYIETYRKQRKKTGKD
ncbi:MAG TPA: DnaJ domain-containing protein [Bacteroidales bacterium]|nr:DnaJ domain-containing protein [Bacteroidales bacterium]